MVGVDAHVFVHVERNDACPVDRLVGNQARHELVLAGRSGEDDPRLPAACWRAAIDAATACAAIRPANARLS